jgi:hypothetical protein
MSPNSRIGVLEQWYQVRHCTLGSQADLSQGLGRAVPDIGLGGFEFCSPLAHGLRLLVATAGHEGKTGRHQEQSTHHSRHWKLSGKSEVQSTGEGMGHA